MKTFIPQKLYGIIGSPLAQTLSPLIHNSGFQALGIPAAYFKWEISPDKLDNFMDALKILPIDGCSVTIPHKKAIMRYLDGASEMAAFAGAANTVFWREKELYGENTDMSGFLKPLENMDLAHADALILGAGGAAMAVAAALKIKGCQKARVASRSGYSQRELAERFNFQAIEWRDRYEKPASLIINCTPLGMKGKYEDETPYDFAMAEIDESAVAYDLVYNPPETRFLREARQHGLASVSGLEMFYFQADEQFRLWTGRQLPRVSREKLCDALGVERSFLAGVGEGQ